jgi:hypothetical protein
MSEDFVIVTNNATAEPPAPEPPPEPKPEEMKPPVEPEETESGEEDEPEEDHQEEKPKKKGGFQRKLEAKDRELAELRERLAQAEQGKTPTKAAAQASEDAEPNPDDFESNAEYQKALVKYTYRQERAKEQAEAAQRSTAEAFQKHWDAAVKDIPDFKQVMESAEAPLSPLMKEAIIKAGEAGPKIAYQLAKNPEESARIASLADPTAVAFELGVIAASLRKVPEPKKPEPKTSAAPKPITPVGGGGSGSARPLSDPEISYEEYAARRRKGEV